MEKFFTTGIPQMLEPRPEMGRKLLTLEQVETIMEHNERTILPVSGDCLEGAQVMDGGWVAVDFTRFPAPPKNGKEDLCMCYAVYPGQRAPSVMCKTYSGVWGTWQMVGTKFDLSKGKHPYNCGMEAKRIFGAVYASWDADGHLLWRRDPSSFPDHLGTMPTIAGSNVGDPMPVPGVIAV